MAISGPDPQSFESVISDFSALHYTTKSKGLPSCAKHLLMLKESFLVIELGFNQDENPHYYI